MEEAEKHIHHHLIERAKRFDRKAQAELYKVYFKAMYNTSLRIVKDEYVAEDIMQDAFIETFKKINELRDNITFGAWLKKIVVNRSISFINRAGRISEHLKEISVEAEEENDIDSEINEIKEALSEIGRAYELVFNLYYIEGFDHEEMASILNVAPSTTRSQLTRAKQKIRKVIQEKREQKRQNYAVG